jgi:hypothetical protein
MRSRTGWEGASPTETVSRVYQGFQASAAIEDLRLLYGTIDLFKQDLQAVADGDLVKLHDLIRSKTATSSVRTHDENSWNPFPPAPAHFRSTPGDFAAPNTESENWREEADGLARSASDKTLKALQDLAGRLGYVPSTNRDPLLSKLPRSSFGAGDVAYCKSALLLQESKADIYSVLKRQNSDQHFICTHCYLEISDFRSNAPNYKAEDWSLLASCHVLACSSLKDRRAAYRCFACFARGHDVIEPSAAAIRVHLDTCEFRKMRNAQGKKNLGKARAYQSSAVEESEQTTYPPLLSSGTPARDTSTSLYTQHASRPSDTAKLAASSQPNERDRVYVPNQSMPPIPRRPAPPAPSSVSADRSEPLAPSLPKSTPSGTATTTERRGRNDDDSRARDFASLSSSPLPAESPAANTPRTPRHANIRQPSTPTSMTNPTSPASITNRASISGGNPEDLTNRGRPQSSRGHQHTASNPSASLPTYSPLVDGASDAAEEAKINELYQLGIPRAQAESLLRATGGRLNEAAELACSNGAIGVPVVEDQPSPSPMNEPRRSRSRRWRDRLA